MSSPNLSESFDCLDQRILVLAPIGRDSAAAALLLQQAGLTPLVCRDMAAFLTVVREGAGAGLIAEEAFTAELAAGLFGWVSAQPPWSDFPFIVLTRSTQSAARDTSRLHLAKKLGNVTLLERPVQVVTLVTAARAALRSRGRQYEARAFLQERERAAQRLEFLVQERTLQLRTEIAEREVAQAALRQSQKMEAVGQLTGGIAHDFNNLLTVIVGSLELLQPRVATGRLENAEHYIAGALAAANRAGALTHRLLSFARRQALDPQPTDANALVASMVDLARRTVGEAIEVRTDLAPGLWSTTCDGNQLENALLNLIINARDAMPDGGLLTIATRNTRQDGIGELAPGDYVQLSVADTGIGMDADVLEKVFEPFFTTKPLGQGTGLGLSMLYGFVKQSLGHVQIASRPGHGTEVKVLLPRREGAETSLAEPEPPAAIPVTGSGETVLVVEDEPLIRMLVLEVLRGLGYTALQAADGPAGLRVVESTARIDLLLTDVGLPGLNGRQLAEVARLRRPGLPVLFVTGYAHNAAPGREFLEPGMHIVSKPFTMSELAAKVRGILSVA